ncbi:MAG TPA: hypothetical protein PK705_05375 [Clostridia bacterium]|nr:hypothetical protein [Clostridia bacterium]
MKKRLIYILLIVLLFSLCGCNENIQQSPLNSITETPTFSDIPEETDNDEEDYLSIKYKTADVDSLIDILNIHYEDKIIQQFESCMVVGQPFVSIGNRYDNDSVNANGVIMSVTKFIQGIIEENDNIVNISIIEDKSFDNGGYIFTNANNLFLNYFDYFDNDKYTMSIYKYRNSYIVFEFYDMSLSSKDKKAFITEFASLLEENYSEKDKLKFNENDEFYISQIYPLNYFEKIKGGLNAYYKRNITTYFQRYTKSEMPLYEISERYTLDEINKEDDSILAVTKYIQGSINDDSIKISFIEDKTSDNKGFIFTTDETDKTPMIEIYRYNQIYIIFEFNDAVISEDFIVNLENIIKNISNILPSILD